MHDARQIDARGSRTFRSGWHSSCFTSRAILKIIIFLIGFWICVLLYGIEWQIGGLLSIASIFRLFLVICSYHPSLTACANQVLVGHVFLCLGYETFRASPVFYKVELVLVSSACTWAHIPGQMASMVGDGGTLTKNCPAVTLMDPVTHTTEKKREESTHPN